MEKRKSDSLRASALPADYLKMVTEVFQTNFDEGLKKIAKISPAGAHFQTSGAVYPSEIVLCVTLVQGDSISATTVYASSDFDPKASSPTIQDLLASCVDAIGTVFEPLFSSKKPEALENLIGTSLSALENVPFEWTTITVEKRRIFVKMDKANPLLEKLTDEWLRKNDPTIKEREALEHQETEKLFVGADNPKKSTGNGSGRVH